MPGKTCMGSFTQTLGVRICACAAAAMAAAVPIVSIFFMCLCFLLVVNPRFAGKRVGYFKKKTLEIGRIAAM